MYPALIINQSGIRKGFMPNDHSTSVKFSFYKACLFINIDEFYEFSIFVLGIFTLDV